MQRRQRRPLSIVLALIVVAAVLPACNRFEITDPTTGRMYYAKRLHRTDSGAIRFRDRITQTDVTLQTSEVLRISKETYREAVQN